MCVCVSGGRTPLNNPPPPSLCLLSSSNNCTTSEKHPDTCTLPHAQTPTEPQPPRASGRRRGKVKVGGSGCRQSDNHRGKLQQAESERGRAAPRANVTDQRLSGVDSAPWMSVIPQRAYAEQQHNVIISSREGPTPVSNMLARVDGSN